MMVVSSMVVRPYGGASLWWCVLMVGRMFGNANPTRCTAVIQITQTPDPSIALMGQTRQEELFSAGACGVARF
ncbi:hypothetical protein [uncultured Roseibium sp.]|uniref:hypothetical protein n=1 Tax=uncultured Roseibium sp. TaxID=1936171 RepID=UPI00260A00AA|nr:hypothetical protein [uncultured Roseibium sp.]